MAKKKVKKKIARKKTGTKTSPSKVGKTRRSGLRGQSRSSQQKQTARKTAKTAKSKATKGRSGVASKAEKTKLGSVNVKGSSKLHRSSPQKKTTEVKPKRLLQIHPLQDFVLVKLLQKERVTPGGIIVPDTVQDSEAYYHGEVTAVGPGRLDQKGKRHPLDVKIGDRVLFQKWAGQKWQDQGDEYVILRENEILGVDEGRIL